MDYEFWHNYISQHGEMFERVVEMICEQKLEFFLMEPILKVKYFTILASGNGKFLIIVSRDYGKYAKFAAYHEYFHFLGMKCWDAVKREIDCAKKKLGKEFGEYLSIRIKAFENLVEYWRNEGSDTSEFEKALEVLKALGKA